MSRNSIFLTLAATALLSAPAHAILPPQTGSGSGSVTVRERCATCRSSAEDRRREKLLLQIDSLRWHIENRRLTEEERRRTVSELNSTIRALQQSLDGAQNVSVSVVTGDGVSSSAVTVAPSVGVARLPMRARGYLGVTFDGPSAEITRPGEHAVRFYKYPRIALVEPSSPAERAGVMQGDTLMSFNSIDVVANEISLSKILVPESKIVMRVRRDGNNKDLKVVVGEAPDYYVRRQDVRGASPLTRAGVVAPTPPAEPARVWAVPAPEAVQPPVVLWQEYEGIAGARVETVSEGLGKALGVDEGVLVVRVRPGTPAYRAGLRDGDVIVRAGSTRIRSVTTLRDVVSMGEGSEGVKLLIRRERKEKDVTLRW